MKNQTPKDSPDRIRNSLNTLKLKTIAAILDDELARATQLATPPTELLERLLTMEADALIQRRIERRIKESKLRNENCWPILTLTSRKGSTRPRLWNWPSSTLPTANKG